MTNVHLEPMMADGQSDHLLLNGGYVEKRNLG